MLAEARFVSSKMQDKGEDEVDHLVIYLQNLDVNRAMDRNSPTDEKEVSVQVSSHRSQTSLSKTNCLCCDCSLFFVPMFPLDIYLHIVLIMIM